MQTQPEGKGLLLTQFLAPVKVKSVPVHRGFVAGDFYRTTSVKVKSVLDGSVLCDFYRTIPSMKFYIVNADGTPIVGLLNGKQVTAFDSFRIFDNRAFRLKYKETWYGFTADGTPILTSN